MDSAKWIETRFLEGVFNDCFSKAYNLVTVFLPAVLISNYPKFDIYSKRDNLLKWEQNGTTANRNWKK